jgi:hypothetical protein
MLEDCKLGVDCSYLSEVSVESSDASDCNAYGFYIQYGGLIGAYNIVGTTNQSVNTLTSAGIIFK